MSILRIMDDSRPPIVGSQNTIGDREVRDLAMRIRTLREKGRNRTGYFYAVNIERSRNESCLSDNLLL